ncbi:MAG TPA: DNA replication/repair protein RecF [Hyphomicrobiales bacterium]|nr:DNA replication/repair protein RecF [Hyphomicrobiales bacterium]
MTISAPQRTAILRLRLTDFRNHATLDLATGGRSVALVGPNGAGKTNVLEAISLLAPGRGLRRAAAGDLARIGGEGMWAVAAEVEGVVGPIALGTGTEPGGARRWRIAGAPAPGSAAFAEHLRIVWLTPAMDGLFTGPPSDRRRFLDRLVLALDPAHGARVAAYERVLRDRNRLLEERGGEERWLAALEREAAELAVAIAAARADAVARLVALIAETRGDDAFPWAGLALDGALEAAVAAEPAAAVEDAFRDRLGALRPRDRAAGRATEGPQTADLVVRHGPKDMPAALSSTGEQKALLVGLVLAHARLVARAEGATPILLLDEVAAHLDPVRRAALYEALERQGAQAWLSGADPAAFAPLEGRATIFPLAGEPGSAENRSRSAGDPP